MEGNNLKRISRLFKSLLINPRQIPFYLKNSVFTNKEPLELGLPWTSLDSIKFLNEFLSKSSHEVLELGGGGSTIFFAQRAKNVTCLESYAIWGKKIISKVNELGLLNVDLKILPYDIDSLNKFLESDFFLSLKNKKYDIILVDNYEEDIQLRPACFYAAEKIIKPGGIIILDDSWRYEEIRKNNLSKKLLTFKSVGPCRYGITTTDIYFY